MITTVTINPALDKQIRLHGLKIDDVNRANDVSINIGGKGINCSKVLTALGIKNTALVVLGGNNGIFFYNELKRNEINSKIVWTNAETRYNIKIVDDFSNTCTSIDEVGHELPPSTIKKFLKSTQKLSYSSDIMILAGSVPTGTENVFYRKIIDSANCKVFLDASGKLLEEAIKANPFAIKPNLSELSELAGKEFNAKEEIISFAKEIVAGGVKHVLVSLGKDGLLYISKKMVLQGIASEIVPINTVGAGDSVVATFCYGIQKNLSLPKVIKLSAAMGTASVMTSGTAVPAKKLVKSTLKQTKVIRL